MRRVRLTAAVCAALVAVALLAGCGSSGPQTFSADGMSIHFKYPASLSEHKLLSVRHIVGRPPAAQAAVGLAKHDLLLIVKYKPAVRITSANLSRVWPAVDMVVGELARRPVTGTPVRIGGHPGRSFKALTLEPGIQSRIYYVVVDADLYELSCQSTAAHRAEIDKACRMMIRTFSSR